MMVVPLLRPEGGAVVSHSDVTERHQAEVEAQRSQRELAHYLRVSTIGELTTSLAHELNQPLAAILANAQTARRLVSAANPAGREVREILEEIIEEDKRAGEVIQRLRELLRKGEPERTAVDVNELVRDVVKLLGSDAMIRGVTLRVDPASDHLVTRGDSVQLQQVVLNLLINAMDAMAECDRDRVIVVRTERTPAETVRIAVEDAGPGLADDLKDRVFEPFFTTKGSGMGMGLPIARSIVVAHGGTMSAANNAVRGATFSFALPLAGSLSL
jgi:C4-dicarboxylate-specific signal transduction histidine kinase